jgi:hypothetical protein
LPIFANRIVSASILQPLRCPQNNSKYYRKRPHSHRPHITRIYRVNGFEASFETTLPQMSRVRRGDLLVTPSSLLFTPTKTQERLSLVHLLDLRRLFTVPITVIKPQMEWQLRPESSFEIWRGCIKMTSGLPWHDRHHSYEMLPSSGLYLMFYSNEEADERKCRVEHWYTLLRRPASLSQCLRIRPIRSKLGWSYNWHSVSHVFRSSFANSRQKKV